MAIIQELRRQYDPLYQHIAPHITLVFPFKSTIHANELEGHIVTAIRDIQPFKMAMQGFTREQGNYLFLNVVEGSEQICKLHTQLYKGLLQIYYPQFLRNTKYKPHLTVGRIENSNLLEQAYQICEPIHERFVDEISRITVEIIDENENSNIEMNLSLRENV